MLSGFGHQPREFLTADACDELAGSCDSGQTQRNGGEDCVAGLVAVLVVHLFEVVKVEDREAERAAVSGCALDLGAEALVEGSVVREAGHRVGRGEVNECLLRLGVGDHHRDKFGESCEALRGARRDPRDCFHGRPGRSPQLAVEEDRCVDGGATTPFADWSVRSIHVDRDLHRSTGLVDLRCRARPCQIDRLAGDVCAVGAPAPDDLSDPSWTAEADDATLCPSEEASDLRSDGVLKRLKAEQSTRSIPVIVLTADASKGQSERVGQLGAAHYLTKPRNVSKFLDIIADTLGRLP